MAKSETKAEERREEDKKERDHRARGGGMHESHAGHRMVGGGMELKTEGDMPGDRARRASGGSSEDDTKGRRSREKVNEYNAVGSPAVKAAEDEEPGFKKGGEARKKRRDGGMASGESEAPRMDRRSRGGHEKRAAGGRTGSHSPYSSGANISAPSKDKSGDGRESNGPA
jgi:hypothetical protein